MVNPEIMFADISVSKEYQSSREDDADEDN